MSVEKKTNRFYIGYRYRNWLPSSEDFGKIYFTSNNYVKENFDNFDHYIIAEFFDKNSVRKFETELIRETKSDLQINRDRIKKLPGKKKTHTKYPI